MLLCLLCLYCDLLYIVDSQPQASVIVPTVTSVVQLVVFCAEPFYLNLNWYCLESIYNGMIPL